MTMPENNFFFCIFSLQANRCFLFVTWEAHPANLPSDSRESAATSTDPLTAEDTREGETQLRSQEAYNSASETDTSKTNKQTSKTKQSKTTTTTITKATKTIRE